MGNIPAAVAEAKRSVAGATGAIAATERPSPVSIIAPAGANPITEFSCCGNARAGGGATPRHSLMPPRGAVPPPYTLGSPQYGPRVVTNVAAWSWLNLISTITEVTLGFIGARRVRKKNHAQARPSTQDPRAPGWSDRSFDPSQSGGGWRGKSCPRVP